MSLLIEVAVLGEAKPERLHFVFGEDEDHADEALSLHKKTLLFPGCRKRENSLIKGLTLYLSRCPCHTQS